MMGSKPKKVLLAAGLGFVLALGSSAVPGRAWASYPEVMGCEQRCEVAASGWPLPYIIDYPGLSSSGVANLVGALVGSDHLRILPFGATWVLWSVVCGIMDGSYRFFRRKP
jgi:hypothetical protein